jgi:hypothetical protein
MGKLLLKSLGKIYQYIFHIYKENSIFVPTNSYLNLNILEDGLLN